MRNTNKPCNESDCINFGKYFMWKPCRNCIYNLFIEKDDGKENNLITKKRVEKNE